MRRTLCNERQIVWFTLTIPGTSRWFEIAKEFSLILPQPRVHNNVCANPATVDLKIWQPCPLLQKQDQVWRPTSHPLLPEPA